MKTRTVMIGALTFAGGVGLLHAPAMRRALTWLDADSGCPFVTGGSDPSGLEAYRVGVASSRRGSRPAKARLALGFELGKARRPEVEASLGGRHARCERLSSGAILRCTIPEAFGTLDAHVQFDPEGRLVAIDAWHGPASSRESLARFEHVTARLQALAGPATRATGRPEPTYLAARPLRRVSREYRCSDYLARVSVTNLGTHGVRLREQYQWVPPET